MPKIDTASIADSLTAERDTPADRPESAILVELIEQIDAAIARGVPRAVIHKKLQDGGFTMSFPTFVKSLQRIRKRLGRPAPRLTTQRRHAGASSSLTSEPAPIRQCNPTPGNRDIKSSEQLQQENPTLTSVQISKMYAQQYAETGLTAERLDELKRTYPPPPPGSTRA